MRFMKFKEYCDWEGEIWFFWLQVDGNEDELDNFGVVLREAYEDDEGEFWLYEDDIIEEEFVDCLVEHGNVSTYTQTHSKITGEFKGVALSQVYAGDIYKGKIENFFKE